MQLDDAVWRQRHRWVSAVLLLHLPLLALWSVVSGTPPAHLGLLVLPAALWAGAQLPGPARVPPSWWRALRSCAASAGLMACSSYLVSVSGGHVEAHFHFFVLISVVALYEAWPPFLVAVAVVLVEHGLVGTLWPAAVYGRSALHGDHAWRFAVVHAAFFAAAWVGSLVTWRLAASARAAHHELTRGQHALVEELRHRAHHDELTGLLNRAGLAQALDAALREGAPVAVVVMDLDRFKEVNDTLGHSAGDDLLRAVGTSMRRALDGAGVLARLGGDEFAVLLPGATGERGLAVARHLRDAASGSLAVSGVLVSVGVSAGVAVHDGCGPGVEDEAGAGALRARAAEVLLRQADVAMYVAKERHAGAVVYDAAADRHSTARLSTVDDLRRALHADDQLVLHFQPQVRMSDGRMVGVEALVRWQHPGRGLLPPSEFVAVAEASDLAEAFAHRVLHLALAQVAAWAARGRRVPVAVNVSPRTLLRAGFVTTVAQGLFAHGVPGALLRVELTEDALVADPDAAARVLGQLRQMGVTTSIDDFGTGFSSLSSLRRLPIDELKIDRSFVTGLGRRACGHSTGGTAGGADDSADEALVASVVDLAHRLGMHVVAEGVEDDEERAVLERLGCDTAQGYYYCRPVPAGELPEELLRSTGDRPSAPALA